MTRRPPGTGTVRTLRQPSGDDPGRFQALGPRGANGHRASLYVGPDRAIAEAYANEAAAQMVAGAAPHLTGITLRAWLTRYLDGREQDASAGTAKAERKAAKHIYSAPWIDDPIDSIRTPEIDEHLVALARRLPGMARSAKALLSGVFAAAARKGLVAGNPVGAVKLPRQVRTHEPWTYLLPDEQAALRAAPTSAIDRALVTAWLFTGLRAGEILSLRVADVHLDRDEIIIRYGSLHGPPKGRKIRTVHLFPPAAEALRAWLPLIPAYLDGHANRYGLVFPGPKGGARDAGHPFRREEDGERCDGWTEMLERAGILRDGSAAHRHDGQAPAPHDAFRHTCGASLASGWWTSEPWQTAEIQAHLRHATIAQTERYAHLAPSVVKAKASRVLGYAMVTPDRVPSGETRGARVLHLASRGSPGLPALPVENAIHAQSVTKSAADLCREALDAAASGDPHAGRRLIEACGAALFELETAEQERRRGAR